MKNFKIIVTVLLSIVLFASANAQVLKKGYYVTEEGIDHRNISVTSDGTIKASISAGTDYYKKLSGNKYQGFKTVKANGNLHQPKFNFYLEIINDQEIVLYRENQKRYIVVMNQV